MNQTTRIVALSDTHGLPFTIPACDICCHCGDWSPLACQGDFEAMYAWLERFVDRLLQLPCRYVIIIAGNHDMVMESESFQDVFDNIQKQKLANTEKKIHYLNCTSVRLMGLNFWGSPVTRQINRYRKYWAFETNYPAYDIPDDTDIILTHQPPDLNGLGNVLWGIDSPSRPLGNAALTNAVEKSHARYHFCGHIHTGNHEKCPYRNGRTIGVNVSLLDEAYEIQYKPFSCEIYDCTRLSNS